MRLLVIGATGFLGAPVLHRARAAGMDVITAGRSELPDSPRHQLVDLAADDPGRIAGMLAEVAPDAVVNCAGATAGRPDVLVAANVNGTYALVKAMLEGARRPRLVHLGSAAEYGRGEPGVPVTELAQPRPAGMYGATKLAGTRLVDLAAAAGLEAVVLRVFNPVGPGAPQTSLPGRLAAELRRALTPGTDVRLGSLDAVRDFVDARDVADAAFAAVAATALPHPVLNIGSGRGVPVRAMAQALLAASGRDAVVRADAAPADSPDSARSADIPWQQADITRAAEDLGWSPRRDLATSLADLWKASA
jgi:nucleoside-diphosphate-sugar epimerase